MNIFNNLDLAESKLILLYAIEKLNMPVTNNQLTNLLLKYNIMNYFSSQQYLNELIENKFIAIITEEGKEFYKITEQGKNILNYFIKRVPFSAKEKVANMIENNSDKIKQEIEITADYIPEKETEFVVECKVRENGTNLIELKINVPTKPQAKEICENWRNNASDIFGEILNSVTKKRE